LFLHRTIFQAERKRRKQCPTTNIPKFWSQPIGPLAISIPPISASSKSTWTPPRTTGTYPGAVGWNWQTQLQDNIRRDLIDKSTLEKLLSASGISNDTAILLYGDNNNWFAAYALWQLKLNGHRDVRLINGGRKKWLEEKRPVTRIPQRYVRVLSRLGTDDALRARKEEVFAILEGRKPGQLVDVRSVDEFTGKIIAPPGMTETAQRAGHIPQAANIPWAQASNEDGTFSLSTS